MNASNQLTLNRTVASATVLANAGELAVGVIKQIAGNDISNSINGSKINSEIIQMLVYQRINKKLAEQSKNFQH
jgi:hypothetical protein